MSGNILKFIQKYYWIKFPPIPYTSSQLRMLSEVLLVVGFTKMHLYGLTLQKASCITAAAHGNFSGKKTQEVVVARGKILELLRPDPNTGKVVHLVSTEAFGLIRSLITFRLTGSAKGKVLV